MCCAPIVGAVLALNGIGGLTLGTLVAFLQLNKNFTQPDHARSASRSTPSSWRMAGAERVFDLMDEQPETDDGYVTLVNAKEDEDGSLTECAGAHRHLGMEASAPGDGTVTYTELEGDVVFDDVDFGYDDG